jgi:hypothetical protein
MKMLAAVERENPEGIRFTSCKLPDGETFVNLLELEEGVDNPLPGIAAAEEFHYSATVAAFGLSSTSLTRLRRRWRWWSAAAAELRGASNTKAKRELARRPAHPRQGHDSTNVDGHTAEASPRGNPGAFAGTLARVPLEALSTLYPSRRTLPATLPSRASPPLTAHRRRQ